MAKLKLTNKNLARAIIRCKWTEAVMFVNHVNRDLDCVLVAIDDIHKELNAAGVDCSNCHDFDWLLPNKVNSMSVDSKVRTNDGSIMYRKRRCLAFYCKRKVFSDWIFGFA